MPRVGPCSVSSIPSLLPFAANRTAKPTWKPIQLAYDSITISGGFSSRMFVVNTIVVKDATTSDIFVEVTKNADWFLKTVGGDGTHKGMCKAVNVLTELGQRLTAQHFPSSSAVAAESDSPPAVDDGDFDPMDALDGDAESSPVKPSKGKYAHKKVRHQILYVDMPLRPPCADAACTDTKQVALYVTGKTAKKIHVHCDCVDWLIAYAADELYFQGVVGCGDAHDGKDANIPAVADLRVEWDFQKKLWQSEFVGGTMRGVKRCFSHKDHNEERWDKLRRASMSTVDISFADASVADKNQVAKEFIVHWCTSISRGDHEKFEADWGVTNSHV